MDGEWMVDGMCKERLGKRSYVLLDILVVR
jgi:hypothetical protein